MRGPFTHGKLHLIRGSKRNVSLLDSRHGLAVVVGELLSPFSEAEVKYSINFPDTVVAFNGSHPKLKRVLRVGEAGVIVRVGRILGVVKVVAIVRVHRPGNSKISF